MAGESTYTSDVLESQKMRDPMESLNYQKEIEDAAKNVQRYTLGGPVVGLNRFQKQAANSEAASGELDRRKAAAEGSSKVASLIDERLAGAANALSDARNKQQNTYADIDQKQSQAIQLADWEKMTGLNDVEQKKRDLDFKLESNQTKRDDALEDAWVNGIIDNKMLDINQGGAMRLQDIDQYYKLKTNEISQGLQDWEADTQAKWKVTQAQMQANAQTFATMFEGGISIVDALLQYVLPKKG